jgi:hypothetical protein
MYVLLRERERERERERREGEEINAVVDKSREGSLKGKGSVRFPPLYQLVLHQLLFVLKILFTLFYKIRCLNEEVKCTVPSPSVSIP